MSAHGPGEAHEGGDADPEDAVPEAVVHLVDRGEILSNERQQKKEKCCYCRSAWRPFAPVEPRPPCDSTSVPTSLDHRYFSTSTGGRGGMNLALLLSVRSVSNYYGGSREPAVGR